jgi:spore coat polysaccharide biosynthesis protein SpsF
MKIGAVVQARMNSSRLPGKSLFTVAGKPMLEYLLGSLQQCSGLDSIILATSCDENDIAIADYCLKNNIICYRGSQENVASRFNEVISAHGIDSFVRLNGDSPMLDYRLIDKAVMLFLEGDYDLVTNVYPRTFPKGQSVEVVRSRVFQMVFPSMFEPSDLEHVTRYFYSRDGQFRIHNFESGNDYGKINLAIDTREDMNIFVGILSRMTRPHWEYTLEEKLEIYRDVIK